MLYNLMVTHRSILGLEVYKNVVDVLLVLEVLLAQ